MPSRSNLIEEMNKILQEKLDEYAKDVLPARSATLSIERLRALIDYNRDTGHLYWKANGQRAGAIQDKGYRTLEIDGKAYYAHRVAWFHHYGKWPEQDLDHINRERDDNRIENLRDVSRSENNRNRRSWAKEKNDVGS